VFDSESVDQLGMSAGATLTGLVEGGSVGIVPALRHFGLVDPDFADWTYPCDPFAGYSRGMGALSGVALTGAAAAYAGGVEVNVLSRGNVFRIISKRFGRGFRIDPAHHTKRWGHLKYWKWRVRR